MIKPVTLLAVLAATAASGCGSIGKSMGSGKSAPDEFKVVTKAPLVVPPDYSLRPPRPGAPRPQELRPEDDAKAALFGRDVGANASEGEKLLVAKAGASAVDPSVRDQVDLEGGGVIRKNQDLADKVIDFGKAGTDATASDPEAEKRRLEEEEAKRRAAGQGQVIIQREEGGGFKLPGL